MIDVGNQVVFLLAGVLMALLLLAYIDDDRFR